MKKAKKKVPPIGTDGKTIAEISINGENISLTIGLKLWLAVYENKMPKIVAGVSIYGGDDFEDSMTFYGSIRSF